MSDFKRQECMFALKDAGILEDWRLIYLYKDPENNGKWYLKQGIDNLGYVEMNKPTKSIEEPFCDLIDWMTYNGYEGVILNTNKTVNNPEDFYFKSTYTLSTYLCRMARQCCVVSLKSKSAINTDVSSIEKFVLYYIQPLYTLGSNTNTIGALCKELTIKNFQYEFSFFKNVDGVLYLYCQNKDNFTDMQIVKIKVI